MFQNGAVNVIEFVIDDVCCWLYMAASNKNQTKPRPTGSAYMSVLLLQLYQIKRLLINTEASVPADPPVQIRDTRDVLVNCMKYYKHFQEWNKNIAVIMILCHLSAASGLVF